MSSQKYPLGEARRKFGIEQGFNASNAPVPNFVNGVQIAGSNLTTGELSLIDGVTAGTETASKAVSLDTDRLFDGGRISRKIYSIAAVSSDLAATTATAFSNGTVTIPAAFLEAGDTLRFRAVVRVKSVDGTDSFQVLVKYAGATIYDTTALASAVTTDFFVFDGAITTRTAHASTGTAYASVNMTFNIATSPGVAPNTHAQSNLSSLANAASHTLVVQGAFGGAGNTAVLEQFDVYHN